MKKILLIIVVTLFFTFGFMFKARAITMEEFTNGFNESDYCKYFEQFDGYSLKGDYKDNKLTVTYIYPEGEHVIELIYNEDEDSLSYEKTYSEGEITEEMINQISMDSVSLGSVIYYLGDLNEYSSDSIDELLKSDEFDNYTFEDDGIEGTFKEVNYDGEIGVFSGKVPTSLKVKLNGGFGHLQKVVTTKEQTTTQEEEQNPSTGDENYLFVGLVALASLIGIGLGKMKLSKLKN